MADEKLTALPAVTSVTPADLVYVVQSGVSSQATAGQVARVMRGITADTDASTITFDCGVNDKHSVTLGGNRTLALVNDYVGQVIMLRLTQDGAGSRTVTWFAGIRWPGGTVPTLTVNAAKTDVFSFVKIAANSYDGFIVGQNL